MVGLAAGVGVAVGSVVVAVLAALVARADFYLSGQVVPWGLALAVAGSVAAVVLARAGGRALGFAAAGGWVIGVGLLLAGRPEGDFVVASDWLGDTFLLLATVAVILSAFWKARAPKIRP